MNKVFLIDAYALIYRSYYALLSGNFYSTQMSMNTGAVHGFMNTLNEVLTKEKPTHLAVAFDHGKTFRHEAFPPYKAQREETPEDIKKAVPVIKEILSAMNIPILQVNGYEADDIIGAVATTMAREIADTEVYMLTPDKDYGQLVTKNVYMYKPAFKGGYDVLGEAEICQKYAISSASLMVDYLALQGDKADNYPGCPGVGEKTAAKLINEWGTCENIIANADNIKGALGKKVKEHIDDIKMSKFLARIVTDYSLMSGDGKLPDIVTLSDEMVVKEWDCPTLSSLLDRLELRSIKRRMLGDKMSTSSQKTKTITVEEEVEEKRVVSYDIFGEPVYETVKVKVMKNKEIAVNDDSAVHSTEIGEAAAASSSDNGTNVNANGDETTDASNVKNINVNLRTVGQLDENIARKSANCINEYVVNYYDNEEDTRNICDYILTKSTIEFNILIDTLGKVKLENAFDAEMAGIALTTEDKTVHYFDVSKKNDSREALLGIIREVLESDKIEKIGHDLKYKKIVLHNHGIELNGEVRDVMIAHYLLKCGKIARHTINDIKIDITGEPGLDYTEIKKQWKRDEDERLKLQKLKGKNLADIRFSDISFDAIKDYVREHSAVISESWKVYEEELKSIEGQWYLFSEIEMPLMQVLYEIETTGVMVNTEALDEVRKTFNARLAQHEQKIYELAGHEFTITNPRQLGVVLFEELQLVKKPKKTKTGYATGEEILTPLRSKHPIVSEILDYRGLKKLMSTYVDALPELINKKTQRIHTTFNQCKTTTGRLSSSDPNLQNIPMRGDDGKEIRRCFVAEPGEMFFSADYSQIELRVMAHMSGDQEMQRAFREKIDIHRATAANVYHKELDEVTGDERSKAKRANFGLIYGITSFGLAQNMGIERSEAKELMNGFWTTFPDIQGFMEKLKDDVRQREDKDHGEMGYSTTLLHRRRYLDKINAGNGMDRAVAEREAMNSPIQGSAADIIKLAMVRIHNRFKENGLRSKMILQVHDELNFSVVPDEKEMVERIVIEEMEKAYPLDVPLVAEHGWGNNWLEAH